MWFAAPVPLGDLRMIGMFGGAAFTILDGIRRQREQARRVTEATARLREDLVTDKEIQHEIELNDSEFWHNPASRD